MQTSKKQLVFTLLIAGALPRCNCDEVDEFIPAANYTPEKVLDFGGVAVSSEKTLNISVLSNGRAALILSGVNPTPDNADIRAKWNIAPMADLMDGLAPGRTSSIAVTYRPCPAAWTGDQINNNFDFDTCPSAPDQIDLVIVDNTRLGGVTITLSAQPVQSPKIEIYCGRGSGHCNDDTVELSECVSLSFGTVSSADTACDLIFEVRNTKRDGKPTGALKIDRLDVQVFDINAAQPRPQIAGAAVGFSIVDMAGNVVSVDPDNPLTVEIPEGASTGAVRMKARFRGTTLGIWRGEAMNGTGLKIYNDDPDNRPFKAVSLSAIGSAPDIQVLPRSIEFGPVPQGSTKTATLTVSNAGDAILRIDSIELATDRQMAKFRITTTMGMPPFDVPAFANNTFRVMVAYTPLAGGTDADSLRIGSNDPDDSPLDIPITGGAVPKCQLDPSDTLVFALPNPLPPPPIPPRSESFRVSNIGFGELTIQEFAFEAPDQNPNHSSLDDFTIMGCASMPCQPNTTLCAPAQAGCTNSDTTFTVVYANNDNSTVDQLSLHVRTNDPTVPDKILVLSAQDVPCFFPTPVITVTSTSLKVGENIRVNGLSSDPGGAPGGGGAVSDYQWRWLFTPGAPPTFDSQGTVNTSFTPVRHGAHILGLDLVNDCGSRSQTPASENLPISPQ